MDKNGCVMSHNKVASEFNQQLKQRVSQLKMQLPDAVLTYVDIYSAKYTLISESKKHGKSMTFFFDNKGKSMTRSNYSPQSREELHFKSI